MAIKIRPLKQRKRQVLLQSKVIENEHSASNAELPFIIIYDHASGRIGIALGYNFHWQCEKKAKEFAKPPYRGEITQFNGLYNKDKKTLCITGVNRTPINYEPQLKTPRVALIHYLIKRHKLPFEEVTALNHPKDEELRREDYKMPIRQVINAIYPIEIRAAFNK